MGRAKPREGQTVGDFLERERVNKKDLYYDPKEFRGSKKHFSYLGAKKREKVKTVPGARFVRLSTALFLCFVTSSLTLLVTLYLAINSPNSLAAPVEVLRVIVGFFA